MFMRSPSIAMVGGGCVFACSILVGCSVERVERTPQETPEEGIRSQELELPSSRGSTLLWNSLHAAALQDTLEKDTLEGADQGTEALWSGVYLYSSPTSTSNYAWARGFTTNLPSIPECAWVDVGDGGVCQRVQCRPTETDTGIGDVHILGTNPPVNLAPDGNGVYPTYASTSAMYSTGNPILALVTGNEDRRGGFVALSFAPEPLNLISPEYDPAIGLDVARDSDFHISWTPSERLEQGHSRINLYLGTGDYSAYINCGWPQRAGKGTIPAALLGDLPAGPGSVSFATMVKNVREPSSQTKRTELRLSTDVYVQGKAASGNATFK